MPAKSSRWYGRSLASAAFRASSVSARIISRIASMRSPSKNMCSVRQRPMPTAPNAMRVPRLLGRVGVGAHVHARRLVAPLHQLLEVLELLGLLRGLVAVDQAGDDLGRRGLDLAGVDLAGRAVDRHPVAFLERLAGHRHRARLVVHFHRRGAADADLAHLARHQRGVRRHAAARGEDAFGRDHAAQIFGRRLDAHEQHLLALLRGRDRAVGVQVDLPGRGARAGGQAGGDHRRPSRPRRCRTPAPAAVRAGRPGCASPPSSSRSASPSACRSRT